MNKLSLFSNKTLSRFYLLLMVTVSRIYASDFCATVAWLEGEITDRSGNFIKTGDNLSPGSVVNVGTKSRAKLLLKDDSIIDLGPISQFKLTSCAQPAQQENIELELEFGILRANVQKAKSQKPREFKLKTPTSVLGVRGTEFFVRWQKDENQLSEEQISVLEGSVEVRSLFDKANSIFKIDGGTEFRAQGIIQNLGGAFRVEPATPPRLDQFNASEQRQMEEATRIEPDFFKHEIDLDSSDKNKPQSKSQQQKIDQFLNEALGEEKNKLLFSAENMDGSLLKNWVSQDLGSCGSRPRGLGSCSVNITNDGFPIYQAVSTSYFENQ